MLEEVFFSFSTYKGAHIKKAWVFSILICHAHPSLSCLLTKMHVRSVYASPRGNLLT